MLTMNDRRSRARALAVLCAVTAVSVLTAAPVAAAAGPPGAWDGLELRPSKRVTLLYVRPDTSLAGYKHVRLAPLQVSFDKNWKPNATRTGANRLNKDDFEKIKKALAEEFASVSARELAKGGYDVVTDAGEDVLDVDPAVVDLSIAAPEKMTAGRSTTYTADPGRMTLVAELRDSETGQLLARVIDQRGGSWGGRFQVASSVSNLAAARQIIARWAAALRAELDAANGKS
jgi:Protein of unknown function (DUF3313)